ncbi:MAG: fibronectin type III domain-containing protein [Spirochaetaceae bacterium]
MTIVRGILVVCLLVLLSACPNPTGGTATEPGDDQGGGTGTEPGDDQGSGAGAVAPTDLTIGAGADSVTLSWIGDSSANDGYEIQRREEGESEWQDLVIDPPLGPDATEYVDDGLPPNTTYHYRIRAVNSFGPTAAEDGWVEFDPITTTQLAAPTLTLPENFLLGDTIALSTNKPDFVRYYYTTNGTDPTFTNQVFDPDVDDSRPDTTAVWQYEGIVLNDPGEYEIRVLARAEDWLDSAITTQTVSVSPKWTESGGTWTVTPGISWNDFMSEVVDQTNSGDTITWSGDATIRRASGTAGTRALSLQHSLTFDAGGHTVILDGSSGGRHWSDFDDPPDGTVVRFQGLTIQDFGGPAHSGFLAVPPEVRLELINVRLENNTAGAGQAGRLAAGGAITNQGGVVVIEDSVLIGNRGLGGGAVASFSGTTIIRRSRFLGNRAWYNTSIVQEYLSGGAILAIGGTVNVADSFFAGNTPTSGPGTISLGGAISAMGGTINVHGSQFVGNESNWGVAAHIGDSGFIRISSSAFYDNQSTSSSITPEASIIYAYDHPEGIDLRSSTFVDNTVLSLGNYTVDATAHNVLLINSPITDSNGFGFGEFETSYIEEELNAADIFVALPDKGPDGEWGTDDDVPGDFRLRADADPAIRAAVIDGGDDAEIAPDFADANDNGNVSEDEPYDLAENARVQDTAIDIGAVEH